MNKKLGIILLILTMSMLAGCSKDIENSSGVEEVNTYYYEIDEKLVPNAKDNILGIEPGIIIPLEPQIIGNKVAFKSRIAAEVVDFYLQFWDINEDNWDNLDVVDSAFEVDGIQYRGINSYIYSSTEGSIYTTAYDGQGGTFLAEIVGGEVSRVVCELSSEVQSQWSGKESDGQLVADGENGFYFFAESSGTILCYDSQFQKKKNFEAGKKVYGIFRSQTDDILYWYGIGEGNKAVLGNLDKGKALYKSVEGLATEYVANVSSEGVIYFADTQNLWRVVDGTPQKVYSFSNNGYLISEVYSMTATDAGKMRLLVEMDGQNYVLTVQEVDSQVEKQEITMAFVDRPLALERSVARFNRKNKEYHITVVNPEDGESEDEFRKRMQMELSVGKGPDIYGHDIVYDVDSYVKNGYLECVDDVFEDTSLYINAAIEASKVQEHLYGVPFECTFDFVYYAASQVGDRDSIRLEELMRLVEASDAEILQEGCGGASIVYQYGLSDSSNTAFIDWENGISYLNGEKFIDFLEFAKKYADTDDVEREFFVEAPFYFGEMFDLKTIFQSFQGDVRILGYPRESGNGIYINTRSLYLSAASQNKDGAKAFLKFLVSGEEQYAYAMYDVEQQMKDEGVSSIQGHMQQFPISKNAIDLLVESAWETNESCFIETDSGTIQIGTPYTEEMIEEFYFIIEHAQPKENRASVIEDLVYEELEPFFSGDVSAEEATEKLHNRVQLYLDEIKTGLS